MASIFVFGATPRGNAHSETARAGTYQFSLGAAAPPLGLEPLGSSLILLTEPPKSDGDVRVKF